MSYILIFLIWSANPLAQFSIEFNSQDACENARVEIAKMSPYQPGGMDATVCVPK